MTAETALLLPTLFLALALLLWVVAVAMAQVRCVDAAREAARALARGEQTASALAAARRLAPEGAQVRLQRRDGVVTVEVGGVVPPPGPVLDTLPGLPVRGRSAAADEGAAP